MSEQLTLIAKLTAKPEFADEIGAGLSVLLDQTRAEEGSIDYHFHRDREDPAVWIIYENWRSRADLDAHFEQPYTKALMERFPDLLAKEAELTFATMVSARP
ncbi:antibiotic biosynthesis monooxygenase [Sphingomonadaceae bacterium OTU29THOMA1]|nr:antibiotic biosynthesis monooxygenase [Sphingomonadaceae bacterium OTU29THOMA1]